MKNLVLFHEGTSGKYGSQKYVRCLDLIDKFDPEYYGGRN